MAEIGAILRKRRREKGLSAKEVASQLNVAESTYRDWENGRRIQGEPYLEISRVLDISLAALLGVEQQGLKMLMKDLDVLEEQVKIIRIHVLSMI